MKRIRILNNGRIYYNNKPHPLVEDWAKFRPFERKFFENVREHKKGSKSGLELWYASSILARFCRFLGGRFMSIAQQVKSAMNNLHRL